MIRAKFKLLLPLIMAATLAACSDADQKTAVMPEPSAITADAIGHYCGMNLTEHIGPKGQIKLRDSDKTIWFSTIREVFAYTILPEEPKAITAIYVQDMGQADTSGNPAAESWIDAKQAYYVIESTSIGGMGEPDALPFKDLGLAEQFILNQGGKIVSFADMPEDYIFRAPRSSADLIGPGEPS